MQFAFVFHAWRFMWFVWSVIVVIVSADLVSVVALYYNLYVKDSCFCCLSQLGAAISVPTCQCVQIKLFKNSWLILYNVNIKLYVRCSV